MLESLKCEVIDLYWLSAYPSCVRWILWWLCALPLSVEVLRVVHCLCERLYLLERGVVYSRLYLPQILSGGSLCGKFCVDELVEILLCEGGDVELCARTSKHILVFAIDPLSLTLSLSYILCLALIHIFISLICLVVFVCVPHLCLTTRASYSTSTLIQRNQKELVQSPSPGIRLHSLVTLRGCLVARK